MFDLGTQELILIFIVAFLVFGPKKLPELGRTLGKGIRELKAAMRNVQNQFDDTELDITKEIKETKDDFEKSIYKSIDLNLDEEDDKEDDEEDDDIEEKSSEDKVEEEVTETPADKKKEDKTVEKEPDLFSGLEEDNKDNKETGKDG